MKHSLYKVCIFSDVPEPTSPVAASANRSPDGFFYCVSAEYKRDFVDLQDKFDNLFDELREDVNLHVPVGDLKQYLCNRFRELEADVQNAGTTNDVMKVVRNECTLAEYSYFEKIANRFDLQEAKKSIKRYCSTLNDFCKHILENHAYAKSFCANLIDSSSSGIVATFKLQWKARDTLLKVICDVLQMTFRDLTDDRVQIVVIEDC